jgi:hypothetical protein
LPVVRSQSGAMKPPSQLSSSCSRSAIQSGAAGHIDIHPFKTLLVYYSLLPISSSRSDISCSPFCWLDRSLHFFCLFPSKNENKK